MEEEFRAPFLTIDFHNIYHVIKFEDPLGLLKTDYHTLDQEKGIADSVVSGYDSDRTDSLFGWSRDSLPTRQSDSPSLLGRFAIKRRKQSVAGDWESWQRRRKRQKMSEGWLWEDYP